MDDATFLRNFSRRGRVVLLADGTALPVPLSVMDDPSRAGATFRINLISPEGEESGDRRTFVPGTTEHRDLPLPLLWQWQLADGHKNAVVVGRIDHIERTPNGLGNARGVFDTGPWGREAERMVRSRMVRGVSGDYSSFSAKILEKVDPEKGRITDDKIAVDRSKLVAATIVAKPAFEDCYIEILDDDQFLPNGIIEGESLVLTAAALRMVRPDMVARLERLEQLEAEQLSLIASATAERVNALRMERERRLAVARVRNPESVTAAFKPMPKSWLSAKAKLQPRDALGRWIEIGSTVRWRHGNDRIGGVKRGHSAGTGRLSGGAPFKQGRVKSFDPHTGEYTVEPLDGTPDTKLKGPDVEVVKAVIPESPSEAQKINQDLDSVTKNLIHGTNEKLGAPSVPDAPAPTGNVKPSHDYHADPESLIKESEDHKKSLDEAIAASKVDDPAIKEVGLDRLSELMGAEIESGDTPFQTNRQQSKQAKGDAKDIALAAENGRLKNAQDWPDRETLGRQLFNNLHTKGETWEKDSAKFLRAGDRLRRLSESRLISKKRRSWIKNTYGAEAPPIDDHRDKDLKWSKAFAGEKAAQDLKTPEASKLDAPKQSVPEANDIGPLVTTFNDLWGPADTDEPASPTAAVDLWAAAKAEPTEAPDAPSAHAPAAPAAKPADAVQKIGGDIVKAQQEKNAPKGDDPLSVHDKALAEGNQWGETPPKTLKDKVESGEMKFRGGNAPALTQQTQGEIDAELYDKKNGSPTGNWTEMAKTMFENLHPDSSWDEADQTTWIEAAKKAMETKHDNAA